MNANLVSISRLTLVLFGVGLSAAGLAQGSGSKARHVFHDASSAETHTRGGMVSTFLLTAEQTEGRYSMVDEVWEPGTASSGHAHHFHSEVFYIVSGQMEWTVNDETEQLGPGDLVYIPPYAFHAMRIVGDENVHALMIYEPAGYERGYFRRGALTEEQRQDPEVMRALMRANDINPAGSELGAGHVFFKASAAESYTRGRMISEFMLTAEQTEGRFSLIQETFGATGQESIAADAGHIHNFHSEVFYVTSGVMEWRVDGDTQQLGPGDLVYIPPGAHHAMRVVGDEDVRAVMLYEPGGYERNYFRRRAMSEEERNDPEVMNRYFHDADINF